MCQSSLKTTPKQKVTQYDKHARDLTELNIGEHVRLQDMHTNIWSQSGVIRKKLPNRSYLVEIGNREIRRRNRRHLRLTRRDERSQQSMQRNSDLDDDNETTPRQPAEPPDNSAQPTSSVRTTRSGRISKPPNRLDL